MESAHATGLGDCFTIKYNGRAAELKSWVGVSEPFNPRLSSANPPVVHQTEGIWDTGATNSAITQALAQQIGLQPTGRATVITADGTTEKPTYIVDLYLLNKVVVRQVNVVEMGEVQGAQVLIGMDVITQGDFSITNYKGVTWFSFRVPSLHQLDYVEDNKAEKRKILRRKFKRNDKVEIVNMETGEKKTVRYKNAHKFLEKGWKIESSWRDLI